jgi:hypothetical protein
MSKACWLKDGCPCLTAICSSCGPDDDGCPVYRWFSDKFTEEQKEREKQICEKVCAFVIADDNPGTHAEKGYICHIIRHIFNEER